MKKIAIIVGGFLILSNLPPLKPLFELFFSPPYYYMTKNHEYDGYEYNSKGKTYDEMIRWFERFKEDCNQPTARLYRTFTIKPQKFWLWGEYLLHPKYGLTYMEVPKGYRFRGLGHRCH